MGRRISVAAVGALLTCSLAINDARATVLGPADKARLLDSLRRQGFNGTTDPADVWKLALIGQIRAGGKTYRIYEYEWSEAHPRADTAHGGEELIVVSSSGDYVGSYVSDVDVIKVKGKDILFKCPRSEGDRIEFTKDGPPKHVWFNGQVEELQR